MRQLPLLVILLVPLLDRPPEESASRFMTRLDEGLRTAHPEWLLVAKGDTSSSSRRWVWWNGRQEILLSVTITDSPLAAIKELNRQNYVTEIGGSCMNELGDEAWDFSRCNGAVHRFRTGAVVAQVDVWVGDCTTPASQDVVAKNHSTAQGLSSSIATFVRATLPPNPALQRTRFAPLSSPLNFIR